MIRRGEFTFSSALNFSVVDHILMNPRLSPGFLNVQNMNKLGADHFLLVLDIRKNVHQDVLEV